MKELKPCPFCGGKCCVCEELANIWVAHCMDCDCKISTDSENMGFILELEAIEAWNTRKEKPCEECHWYASKNLSGICSGHPCDGCRTDKWEEKR